MKKSTKRAVTVIIATTVFVHQAMILGLLYDSTYVKGYWYYFGTVSVGFITAAVACLMLYHGINWVIKAEQAEEDLKD